MASLDFVIDLTQKFKKQNIDYIILTSQVGKKKRIPHLFWSINDIYSLESLAMSCFSLSDLFKELAEKFEKEEAKNKKTRRKKK